MTSAELLERLSLATTIDPPLLRRARHAFVPDGDAGTEVDVWMSPLVASRGPTSITLSVETRSSLARSLATTPDRYEAAWRFLERCRASGWRSVSPTQAVDEELFYLRYSHRSDGPQRAAALLDAIARELAEPDREALAYWAEGLIVRLSPNQRELREATDVAHLVRRTLDGVRVAPPAGDGADDEDDGPGLASRIRRLFGRFRRWYASSVRANLSLTRHQMRWMVNLGRRRRRLQPDLEVMLEPLFPGVDLGRVKYVERARLLTSEPIVAITSYRTIYFRDEFDPDDPRGLIALMKQLVFAEIIQRRGFQPFLRQLHRRPSPADDDPRSLDERADDRVVALGKEIERIATTSPSATPLTDDRIGAETSPTADSNEPAVGSEQRQKTAPPPTEPTRTSGDERPTRSGRLDLVMVNARSDQRVADDLTRMLERMGHAVWTDAALPAGSNWWEEILDSIRRSSGVVLVMTDEALRSETCRAEIAYATDLDRPIVPITVGDRSPTPVPMPQLAQLLWYQYEEVRRSSGAVLDVALSRLTAEPRPLPDPLPPPPAFPSSEAPRVGRVDSPADLSAREQEELVEQLREHIDRGDSKRARELARGLRERPDLLATVAGELDELLGPSDAIDSLLLAVERPMDADQQLDWIANAGRIAETGADVDRLLQAARTLRDSGQVTKRAQDELDVLIAGLVDGPPSSAS